MRRSLLVGAVAVAALLALAGGAYARGAADQALAVAVDGPGTITGTGITCRDGTGDCVELYAEGTQVMLTASPDSGATFTGWGGDCSAATGITCTLTMSSAKAVTATFTSGGGSGNPTLTVSVTGTGKVTGKGIDCGNSATDCSESYTAGTAVTLTETRGTGATFSGWGGACNGTGTTCTVTMNSSQSVMASFSVPADTSSLTVVVAGNGKVTGPGIDCGNGGADCTEAYATGTSVSLTESPGSGATFSGWSGACSGSGPTCIVTMSAATAVKATFGDRPSRVTRRSNTLAVHSLGRPLVVRTPGGWAVTVRFHTSRAAPALLRLSLNGRYVRVFAFKSPAGGVLVGPFKLARAGAYLFRLTLSDGRGAVAELVWNLCLSSNSCRSFR